MAEFKEGCGHPREWNLRVNYNGRIYSYCIGCIVERLGLDNLEAYDNPFDKLPTTEVKEKLDKTKKTKTEEKLD